MSKYGLQLRVKSSEQKKPPTRPPLRPPAGFRDDDEDDVESEISRQAFKNKALKDIEEQHKKALEEDPSVFDYDGVYDDMKQKAVLPMMQDRQERKPRYIQALMDKAKIRDREQEIVYERKLAKERSKEDHLYEGKDKFVTSAYKRKLAETEKWMAEERIRELREEKEDITKKGDMSDFYFNLSKNVAFGAREAETRKKQEKRQEVDKIQTSESPPPPSTHTHLDSSSSGPQRRQSEISTPPKERSESVEAIPVSDSSTQEKEVVTEPVAEQPKHDHHKKSEDAVAAARERFLARKKAKVQ